MNIVSIYIINCTKRNKRVGSLFFLQFLPFIDNFDGTKYTINKLVLACETTTRYVYKVIKEFVEGKNNKNYTDK